MLNFLNSTHSYADNKKTWIKITCFGPTVPYKQNYPKKLKVEDIVSFYLPFISKFSIPASLEDIRDQNLDKFSSMNDRCHTLRLKKTDLSNLQSGAKWLDWNTDYMYAGFKFSFIYSQVGVCQKLNGPCLSTKDCCNSTKQKKLFCDVITNSCNYPFEIVDKQKDILKQD